MKTNSRIEQVITFEGYVWEEIESVQIGSFANLFPILSPILRTVEVATIYNKDDFLRDMLEICEDLCCEELEESEKDYVHYIGVREYGVDGTFYVEERLSNPRMYGTITSSYIDIFRINMDKSADEPVVTLYKMVFNPNLFDDCEG